MLGFQFYGLDDEVCMLPLAFFPLSRLIRGQKGDVAGFSAIPMLGFQFYGLDDEVCMLPLAFFPLSRLIRGQKGAEAEEAAKILVNVVCFVLPVLLFAYETRDRICYLACFVFVINGIFIGS